MHWVPNLTFQQSTLTNLQPRVTKLVFIVALRLGVVPGSCISSLYSHMLYIYVFHVHFVRARK